MTPAKTFKTIVVLLLLAGRSAAQDAAQLRALLVIDSNAAKVGGDDRLLRDCAHYCLNKMQALINDVNGSHLQGRIFCNVLEGNDATPDKIREFYKQNVGYDPNNHLLFFYFGHGGFDKKLGHMFATSGGDMLRREVYHLMADTGARGIFILSDCCSNYGTFTPGRLGAGMKTSTDDWTRFGTFAGGVPVLTHHPVTSPLTASVPSSIVRSAAQGQAADRRTNVNMFYDLFYRSQGLYNMTSATEGQYSWGGIFTEALHTYLTASSSSIRPDGKTGTVDWNSLYFKVRNRTNSKFHETRLSTNDQWMNKQALQIPQAFCLGKWPKNQRRSLAVKNDTGHNIRVFVKYYELDFASNTWGWREPQAFWAVKAGQTTLQNGKDLVGGQKMRIWAETEDRSIVWDEYRDKDLQLAPEEGFHGPIERFVFTFNRPVEE